MRFNSGTEVSVSAAGAHQDEADTPVHPLGIAIRAGLGRVAAAAGISAALLVSGAVNAQDTTVPTSDFLFVQTATAMAFDADQSRLTLRGVSPVTLFFSGPPGSHRRKHEDHVIRAVLGRGQGQLSERSAQRRPLDHRGWRTSTDRRRAGGPGVGRHGLALHGEDHRTVKCQ